jgi:fatty acid desaturase
MAATARVVPTRLNLAIFGGLAAANLLMLAATPLLLPRSAWWALLALPAVLLTPTLWATIHEAIHGVLHPSKAWNDRLGRVLGGLFGAPFQLLRLGHLQHHRFNRSPLNRPEVVEPSPPGPAERVAYYFRLCCGLYLGELVAGLLAVLPDLFYRPIIKLAFGDEAPDGRSMWAAAKRQLLEEPGRSRMRLDGLLIGLGLIGAFWLYGPFWWVLALALAARAFLVSFHDNIYHYANPLEDPQAGWDLSLPRWGRLWLLNFNHHATHHHRPTEPWTALPAAQAALGRRYEARWLPAALRQLRGPIPEPALPKRERRRPERAEAR